MIKPFTVEEFRSTGKPEIIKGIIPVLDDFIATYGKVRFAIKETRNETYVNVYAYDKNLYRYLLVSSIRVV